MTHELGDLAKLQAWLMAKPRRHLTIASATNPQNGETFVNIDAYPTVEGEGVLSSIDKRGSLSVALSEVIAEITKAS